MIDEWVKRASIEEMRQKWTDNPAMPAHQRTVFNSICDMALQSLKIESVKVKGLEWGEFRRAPSEPWGEIMLQSSIGHHKLGRYAGSYVVFEIKKNGPWGWRSSWISDREPEGIFPTADEAKAAAQADYEARILSALVASPYTAGEPAGLSAKLKESGE